MKITIDGHTLEGTPEELKELFTLMGAEFPVKESKETAEDTPTFREGDRVKTLADGEDGDIKAGEVGEITDIFTDEDDPYTIGVDTKDGFDYFRPEDLELVDEDKSKLKVGDYAKVIRADKFNVGDIVYIYDEDSVHFEARRVNDPYDYWHYADKEGELVKATDEEIKMAKLDRKPGEFKKGDIVRVINSPNALPVGSIFEIKEKFGDVVQDEDGFVYDVAKRIELIAPVESRVDMR